MQRKQIMIVDDDATVCGLIKYGLEQTGRYEVVACHDGPTALAAMCQHAPDFVLLDLMMPGMDGGEVALRMKQDPVLHNIPTVFLTSLATSHDGASGHITHGDYQLLAKPTSPSQLIACIEKELAQWWSTADQGLASTEPKPAPRPATVLIVEDDRNLREFVGGYLTARGFATLTAENGAVALGVLATYTGNPVDVLVTDLKMPCLDGGTLANRVHQQFPQLQVIFMSGHEPGADAANFVRAGATLLRKPFLPDELAAAIDDVLGTPV